MKRYIHIILYIIAALGTVQLSSCDDHGINDEGSWEPSLRPHYLNILNTSAYLDADTDLSSDIEVESYGTPWRISGMADWVRVSPESGTGTTTVTISATENYSADESRTCIIKLYSEDPEYSWSHNIGVYQASALGYIRTSEDSIKFVVTGGTKDITVESNSNYRVSWFNEITWLTAEKSSDGKKVTIKVEPNPTASPRSTSVSLSGSGFAQKNIIVTQAAAGITASEYGPISVSKDGGIYKLETTADAQWTVTNNDYSWIEVTPTSGNAGKTSIVFNVAPNYSELERIGRVTFSIGNSSLFDILIKQEAQYFNTTPSGFSAVPSTGGTHTLTISTNESWTAKKNADWYTLSATSGTGDIELKMNVADNPSIHDRQDVITITPEYTKPIEFTLKQAARYLSANTQKIYFFNKGGNSEPVIISTDGTYVVKASDSWIDIKEAGKSFVVTATENTADKPREGKVTIALTGLVEGESKIVEIPVIQTSVLDGPGIEDFKEDENWSLVVDESHATITISRFGTDEDWNKLIR